MKYSEAKDEMFGTINNIVFPLTVEKRFQGQELPDLPTGYWLRVSAVMADESQATLSDDVGAPGQKRYNSAGLLFVQMFGPKQGANSDRTLLTLSELVQSTLRQANGKRCVTFRNVRINDLTPEDQFYRYNVIAEFEFDQIA